MKRNYIGSLLATMLIAFGLFSACQTDSKTKQDHAHAATEYTCPMHPHVVQDKPGKCPVCGMDLVRKMGNHELMVDSSLMSIAQPVNAQVVANIPLIVAERGMRILSARAHGIVTYDDRNKVSLSSRVGGRIERLLIKYNYQPVRKGQLIMEIYSPDLAAAQRELLMLSRDPQGTLLESAKQRLLLLGMTGRQIQDILKSGKILYSVPVYSPASGYILEQTASAPQAAAPMPAAAGNGMQEMGGGASSAGVAPPVQPASAPTAVLLRAGQYVASGQTLFTIYQSSGLVAEFSLPPDIAIRVKTGKKLLFYTGSEAGNMYNAKIGLIEPVIRNGQSFTVARVYLGEHHLSPGQIVTAFVSIVFENGLWLDRKAIWETGGNSMVFKREREVLVPMKVETGLSVNGQVQIKSDIADWKVTSNASYLIDSDSFIKDRNIAQN